MQAFFLMAAKSTEKVRSLDNIPHLYSLVLCEEIRRMFGGFVEFQRWSFSASD